MTNKNIKQHLWEQLSSKHQVFYANFYAGRKFLTALAAKEINKFILGEFKNSINSSKTHEQY